MKKNDFTQHYKDGAGFTFIEILVVVGIFGMIAVIGSNMFFSILRGSAKTRVLAEVKQNGNYAISVMGRMVRNSREIVSCSSSSLKIKNPDRDETEFKCVSEEGVTKIASESGRLTGKNVTLGTSCPGSLSFSCDLTKTPPVVIISFTLSHAGGTRAEEIAQVEFKTTVSLRTY